MSQQRRPAEPDIPGAQPSPARSLMERRNLYLKDRPNFVKGMMGAITKFAMAGIQYTIANLQASTDPVGAMANSTAAANLVVNAGADLATAVTAFQPANEFERKSWELIITALAKSCERVTDLLDEFMDLPDDPIPLDFDAVEYKLQTSDWRITPDFLKYPASLPILAVVKETILRPWLRKNRLPAARIPAVLSRLDSEFTFRLHEEWQSKPDFYKPVLDGLNTPFAGAAERAWKWIAYDAFLQAQANASVFGESFGLQDIYIDPRAYWKEIPSSFDDEDELRSRNRLTGRLSDSIWHVHDLTLEMTQWANKPAQGDFLRILAGGPGSGKSSFAKIFAARIGTQNGVQTIYVPLQSIRFDIKKGLGTALTELFPYLNLPADNVLAAEYPHRVLLLLDGLDELALQSPDQQEEVRAFVTHIRDELEKVNHRHDTPRILALIGGRTFIVDDCAKQFRDPCQVWHLLSYQSYQKSNIKSGLNLAAIDQRNIWWEKYGTLIGKRFDGMPDRLKSLDYTSSPEEGQESITAQPLLEYLIARVYDDLPVSEEGIANLNRVVVYETLLDHIYRRTWGGNDPQRSYNRALKSLSYDDFLRVLEEIAMAIWHGENSRTTTLEAIEKRCEDAGKSEALKTLSQSAEQGILRLMTAFYFGRAGVDKATGKEAFEFTHKTFGEYLVASRLTRLLKRTTDEMERRADDGESGWSAKDALVEWVRQCGLAQMTNEIAAFWRELITSKPKKTAGLWQVALIAMMQNRIDHSYPLEKFISGQVKTLKDLERRVRFAEESLFVAHSCCYAKTQQRLTINWPNPYSARAWINSIQYEAPKISLILKGIDLTRVAMAYATLNGAYLVGVDLAGADLTGAILIRTDLTDASLIRTNLIGANLTDANLNGANLTDADLNGANLTGVNLMGANLNGTRLNGARLNGARLTDADLNGASLNGADLNRARLDGADLDGADLTEAKLDDADFRDAHVSLKTIWPNRYPPAGYELDANHRMKRKF